MISGNFIWCFDINRKCISYQCSSFMQNEKSDWIISCLSSVFYDSFFRFTSSPLNILVTNALPIHCSHALPIHCSLLSAFCFLNNYVWLSFTVCQYKRYVSYVWNILIQLSIKFALESISIETRALNYIERALLQYCPLIIYDIGIKGNVTADTKYDVYTKFMHLSILKNIRDKPIVKETTILPNMLIMPLDVGGVISNNIGTHIYRNCPLLKQLTLRIGSGHFCMLEPRYHIVIFFSDFRAY